MGRMRFAVLIGLAAALGLSGCLADVGASADVVVGFHVQGGTALERDLALEHGVATTNHGLSWSVLEPSPGAYNFAFADAANTWATANNLAQTGMHFAWDQELLDDLPAWVEQITDPVELAQVLRDRADTIFVRYPNLDRLVVVNEPLDVLGPNLYQNHFHDVLGPDYIAILFAIVAEAAPASTELILNENLVEYSQPKADALLALAADLVAAGVQIDGVGLQSHFLLGEPDWPRYRSTIAQLGALGLDVHLTELDVPVAADAPDRLTVQGERYRLAVESCLAVPACRSITFWGVTDAHTWLDGFLEPGLDPLLFDDDGAAKPAFWAVARALAAGRTG